MKKSLTISAAAVAAALALAGCSAGSEPGPGGTHHGSSGSSSDGAQVKSSDFNEADTLFAQMMIPHHEQAVAMSDIVLAKEGVPEAVTTLAARIKAAQGPEIERMAAWLRSWGQPVEASGHAGHGMSGMVSAEDMKKLADAPGPEAATLFLAQMIAHHEGAVTMAKTEATKGKNPDAVQLGKEIISSQEEEIHQMRELLGGGPAATGLPSSHVHGLSVDSGTGQVLLATHEGLFDVTSSPATRIGENNDLMGFTAAGQGVFYASGHPGPGSDLPNPMGLIKSEDGGRTWQKLSRQGESDFHALTVSRSGIVAYDGKLLTSPDGRTWSTAKAGFAPAVLAGIPSGDTVLATTRQGLQRSTDGGKTWDLNSAAPIIQFAAFASSTAVFGVEPDGTVHSSSDAGSSWSRTGRIEGRVQAVAALEGPDGKGQLWAATSDGLVMSSDGGSTFAPARS